MSELVPILLGVAVALAVLGTGVVVFFLLRGVQQQRLGRRLVAETHASGAAPFAATGQRHEWLARLAEQGQYVDRRVLQKPEETTALLAQAGWRDVGPRAVFYASQVLAPLLVLLAGIPLWPVLQGATDGTSAVLIIVVLVILAFLAPRYILRMAAQRRRESIRAEVPLLVNLLILLFEAGLSTRQALTSLVRDGAGTLPTLVQELQPVLRQIEAGADAGQLLYDMGKLLEVSELESVLGILRQVERYGGEIREPLADVLETIEERRTLELREHVNVMSGKMTVVLVACFFPALLIIIVGPAFMSIVEGLGSLR